MRAFFFLCNSETERECLDRKLMGTNFKQEKAKWLSSICPGTIIFLYNYYNDTIWGPMVAATQVKEWVPDAWEGKFKAQVKVDFGNDFKKISLEQHSLVIEKLKGIYPNPLIDPLTLKKLFAIFGLPDQGHEPTD